MNIGSWVLYVITFSVMGLNNNGLRTTTYLVGRGPRVSMTRVTRGTDVPTLGTITLMGRFVVTINVITTMGFGGNRLFTTFL